MELPEVTRLRRRPTELQTGVCPSPEPLSLQRTAERGPGRPLTQEQSVKDRDPRMSERSAMSRTGPLGTSHGDGDLAAASPAVGLLLAPRLCP